ncbi:MAG: bifunctional nuclease family protein [Planctomycetes bacterium]|nr:bifunctional nuclease family protein [Planctomycetota bacterium]
MEVQVEISKIIINETVAQQVIVLKETEGQRRFFPMVIGMPEILAIDRRLKGKTYPRPLTHDLLANLIQEMDGILTKVVITDLNDHTFYANLVINQNGKSIIVDCRPSDAMALGVGLKVPFYVEEQVFEKL